MEVYESQHEEIRRMAKRQSVSEADLAELIEKQTKDVKSMHPDQTRQWQLWRMEREVWNKLTKDKFPGRLPAVDYYPRNNENCRPSTSKSNVADQPWIHDKFNPSPGPPLDHSLRPGQTDSYRPSSPPIPLRSRDVDFYKPLSSTPRQTEIDSYRPSSSSSNVPVSRSTISQRSRRRSSVSLSPSRLAPQTLSQNHTTSSTSVVASLAPGQNSAASRALPKHYLTLDPFIRNKVLGMGVSSEEYSLEHRRFTREVNERHSVEHVTPQWLLWRIECSIWEQFFPQTPSPGQEPVMIHPAPAGSYLSRWRSIENKAMVEKIPLSTVEAFYKERVKYAERKFSQSLSCWKVWFAESTTWSHFWTEQFHGVEPLKYNQGTSATKSANMTFVSGTRSATPRHSENSPMDNSSNASMTPIYQIQESLMISKLARQRIDRHIFFKYLQSARDWARLEHAECTKDVRNYLADKKTWERFFNNEKFPGVRPFGGHSAECIQQGLKPTRTVSRPHAMQLLNRDRDALQGQNSFASQNSRPNYSELPSQERFSVTMPHPLTATSSMSQEMQAAMAFINIKYDIGGAPMTLGRANKSAITTLTVDGSIAGQVYDAFMRNDARQLHRSEERLNCRLENTQTAGSLTFTVKPFQPNDAASLEVAFRLVVNWVETCVRGDVKSFSSFTDSFSLNPNVRDASVLTAQAFAAPISLLVNGKNIPIDSTEFERVQRKFSEDRDSRKMLEYSKGCRFVLVEFDGESKLKHLLAVTTTLIDRPDARSLDLSTVLWHPEEGNVMNVFLEKWAVRVAGSPDDFEAPSIPTFWSEYRHYLSPDGSRSSSGSQAGNYKSVGGNGGSGAPAGKYGDNYLDDMNRMIKKEASKVIGSSRDAGPGLNSGLGGYRSAPQDPLPELNYLMSRAIADRNRNDRFNTRMGGEKRKLLNDNTIDTDGDAEEGEIREERAEKRSKFAF